MTEALRMPHPVDLVDEQNRLVARPDGLEKRALEQELGTEQPVHGLLIGRLMLRQRPDLQHLPGIVPFVQCLVRVDALVALQPDQPPAENCGQDLGDLGLADPDLALQQHRPVQRQRYQQGSCQTPVCEVAALPEPVSQLTDGSGVLHRVTLLAVRTGVSGLRLTPGQDHAQFRPRGSACPRAPASPAMRH